MKILILASLLALSVGCTSATTQAEPTQTPEPTPDSVTTTTTSQYEVTHTGVMVINQNDQITFELYGTTAPITVENFVNLANDGFYEGIIFHRVIEGFMIQGGDPTGTGTGGSGTTIKGEFSENGVNNPIDHTRGVLSMARSSLLDSASSQFFIMHEDSPHLNGSYAAFGMVTSGMEVVDAIATTQTNNANRPNTDVIIKSVTITPVVN